MTLHHCVNFVEQQLFTIDAVEPAVGLLCQCGKKDALYSRVTTAANSLPQRDRSFAMTAQAQGANVG